MERHRAYLMERRKAGEGWKSSAELLLLYKPWDAPGLNTPSPGVATSDEPGSLPKVTKLSRLCKTSLKLCPAHSSCRLPFICDPDGAAPSLPAGIKSHLLSPSFIISINDFNQGQNLLPCTGLGFGAPDLGSHRFCSQILQWNGWRGARSLPVGFAPAATNLRALWESWICLMGLGNSQFSSMQKTQYFST